MPAPDQIEDFLASKIAQAVQASPDDALLGFLDVDPETQQAVLDALRNRPSFSTINQYLRRYPALTCYGLSVAVSIGLEDEDVGSGAIYGAWREAIGFFPPNNERWQLAQDFIAALKAMGLPVGTISPDQDLHWMGGCYLFHGAVLPHFVAPLRAALASAQRMRPLPDLEDPERVTQFAHLLASKVHPAQTRLKKTLLSQVGPFLVGRLIQWLLTRDNSLFPAHIQPLLKEQQQRAALLHAPYIQFDEDDGELFLILPAQTGNVADSATRWIVDGRQYRAASETPPLSLDQLGFADRSFEIKLTHLKDGREDCAYQLEGSIAANRGFRIFDAASGREKKISDSPSHTLDLPVGQAYWIVLGKAASVQSDHEEEEAGDFRFVRYEVTLGSEALVIENAGVVWTLKPKVRPGLYLTPSDAYRFRATRSTDQTNVFVSYGEAPQLACVIPSDDVSAARVHFATRFNDSLTDTFEIPGEACSEPVRLVDLGSHLERWVNGLPKALHAITVRLESGNRRMEESFFHWKGLERISLYGDFRCEEIPTNLQACPGFVKNGNVIERPKKQRGKAELSWSKVGLLEAECWEVPANRVKITLASPTGGIFEIEEGAEIEVLPDDDRVIQMRTGGLLPIRLISGARVIGEISNEKPLLSKFLSAIAAEHGRTGSLKAEVLFDLPGMESWPVLNWCTPQTAKECRLENSERTQVIWLVRKVSITGVDGLRLRLIDLVKKLQGEDEIRDVPLEIPAEVEATVEIPLAAGFECSVRRKPDNLLQIRLVFDRELTQGQLWVTELECLLADSEVWQPIMSREKYGRLATIRFLFIGATPGAGAVDAAIADLFWGRPNESLSADSSAWEIHGAKLDRWLVTLRWLIACKYPTPVWHQNSQRFESLYRRFSSICLLRGETEKAIWWKHAIEDLQRHANQPEAVVIPTLLITSNLKMAATDLHGCNPAAIVGSETVESAFREACLYQWQKRADDLGYVRDACGKQRIDIDFLSHFQGWNQLLGNRPVPLGSFDYRGWSNRLIQSCSAADFHFSGGSFPQLSSDHFMLCQRKALRRMGVIMDVAEQEHGHWLSEPFSQLRGCCDRSCSAIRSILGGALKGDPESVFLAFLNPEKPSFTSGLRLEYLRSLNVACCLTALALRAKSRGNITAGQMISHLNSLIPNQQHFNDDEEKLCKQVALVIGTAPELFSFYFLMFTLTI